VAKGDILKFGKGHMNINNPFIFGILCVMT